MFDPKHGVDYLIDRYSVLDVPRDADTATIEAAFSSKLKLYHPDRMHGLAPELVAQAESRTRTLIDARETLCDPHRRAAYDAQLAGWKGPISKNGESIVDLGAPGFRMSALLSHLGSDEASRMEEAETTALQFSNFNAATYEVIKAAYEAQEHPPESLRKAYLEQVAVRDLYLNLKESFLWDEVGVQGLAREHPELEYTEAVKVELAATRARAMEAVQKQVLLLTTEGLALLPAPAGLPLHGSDPAHTLERYTELVDGHFVRRGEQLAEIASERQTLLGVRFAGHSNITYREASSRTPLLVIEFRRKDGEVVQRKVFGLNVAEKSCRMLTEPSLEPWSDERALALMAQGYSIVSFTVVDDIDIKSQINRVIDLHLEEIEKTNQDTAPS